MARSHWYDSATRTINDVLDKLDLATASRHDIEQAVGAAYPFGVRQHWPYKQWQAAKKHVLRARCPRLFSSVTPGRGVDGEAARGLFATNPPTVDRVDDVHPNRDGDEADGDGRHKHVLASELIGEPTHV